MKPYLSIFVLLTVLLFSCKKEYTQREKDRLEELTANHIYKYKVPDESFVFCLDTIKADFEYAKLADEYCRRGLEVDSYLYLSSYKIYVPIKPRYFCNDDYWYCGRGRRALNFIVNKDRKWLLEDELLLDLNQDILDSIITEYYLEREKQKRSMSSMIHFDSKAIKDNSERDSLYISFLKGYYSFIKNKKKETNVMIDSLVKKYPFNLSIGQEVVLLPIPPPSKGVFIIE